MKVRKYVILCVVSVFLLLWLGSANVAVDESNVFTGHPDSVLIDDSQWFCQELASSGKVKVFTTVMGMFHYCVLTNICIYGGNILFFNHSAKEENFDFPTTPLLQRHKLQVTTRSFQTMINDSIFHSGTSVIMAHAYCCSHPTHYMEPLGALHAGLLLTKRSNCNRQDVTCIDDNVNRIVEMHRDAANEGTWAHFVLQIVMGATNLSLRAADQSPLSTTCYQKAIVPGGWYSIWATQSSASAFQIAASQHVSKQRFRAPEMSKKILLALRKVTDRGRCIVDHVEVLRFMEFIAKPLGITVERIWFGDHPPMEQAMAAADADIFIGLHGADLTNMVFQRPGAVVIELNPLYFFENRFHDMASMLKLKYYAWTCTTRRCAFGGDEQRYDAYFHQVRDFYQNESSGNVSFAGHNFRWPATGYAGNCKLCNEALLVTGLRHLLYGALRDNPVKLMPEAFPLLEVLHDAFVYLGWMKANKTYISSVMWAFLNVSV